MKHALKEIWGWITLLFSVLFVIFIIALSLVATLAVPLIVLLFVIGFCFYYGKKSIKILKS